MSALRRARGKRATLLAVVAVLLGMAGLTAAAPDLYRLFCQVTGYGGTTATAPQAPGAAPGAEQVTVRFNADTGQGMPWRFQPVQERITLAMGERATAYYEAFNPTGRPVAGMATFNVTPMKAGPYFTKIACFCFTEHVLQPGERLAMPVTFFVAPEMAADPLTEEIRTVTLSYTFFELEGESGAGDATATLESAMAGDSVHGGQSGSHDDHAGESSTH